MRTRVTTRMIIGALVVGGLALSGCTRKAPPAAVSDASRGENIYAAAPTNEGAAAAEPTGSQAALIAAAGSDRVLFAVDSSSLDSDAQQTLVRQLAWLRQHPEVSFTIEGHCDERGTREYNLALGDKRANSVASYLASQGIAASRIRTISYGKDRPEATASDEEAYAQNRRAVSIVVNGSVG